FALFFGRTGAQRLPGLAVVFDHAIGALELHHLGLERHDRLEQRLRHARRACIYRLGLVVAVPLRIVLNRSHVRRSVLALLLRWPDRSFRRRRGRVRLPVFSANAPCDCSIDLVAHEMKFVDPNGLCARTGSGSRRKAMISPSERAESPTWAERGAARRAKRLLLPSGNWPWNCPESARSAAA